MKYLHILFFLSFFFFWHVVKQECKTGGCETFPRYRDRERLFVRAYLRVAIT